MLKKLREPATPLLQDAWGKFVHLYTPLLFLWARRLGASKQDAPDLVQDVFVVLAREMPRFRHDPGQRFRGWLWTVLRNYHARVHEDAGGIVFLRQIAPGSAGRSYGIHVARLAGVPREVLQRAEQVLGELEGKGADRPVILAPGRESAVRQAG